MNKSMKSLVGKVALLVGGQRDYGAELATDLASQGCDIALVYPTETRPDAKHIADKVTEIGRNCLLIPETVGAKQTVQRILNCLGRLDIFIHYSARGDVERLQTVPLPRPLFPDLVMTKTIIRELAGLEGT